MCILLVDGSGNIGEAVGYRGCCKLKRFKKLKTVWIGTRGHYIPISDFFFRIHFFVPESKVNNADLGKGGLIKYWLCIHSGHHVFFVRKNNKHSFRYFSFFLEAKF